MTPWKATEICKGHFIVTTAADACIQSKPNTSSAYYDAKTAAMIAAAPELLAAIEPIFANAFSNGELATRMRISPEQVALVRAAIARAEGAQ